MVDLPPDIEQKLADMTDGEWAALQARVRAPDTTEQFREIVKSVVPQHADELMKWADVSKFVGEDGAVDDTRLRSALGVLFGNGQPQSFEWGQHGSSPPGPAPGDNGRAEAQRRAERNGQPGTAAGAEALRRMPGVLENAGAAEARRRAAARGSGAGGRAEAARRRCENGGQ